MPRLLVFLLSALVFIVLAAFVFWPEMDLAVSGLFAHGTRGFYLIGNPFLKGLSKFVFYIARVMAAVFAVGVFFWFVKKRNWLGLEGRAWVFLLMTLLIGPGLIANIIFKDHWGRARPREIVTFGGSREFTPAMVVSNACSFNCSFVSGDASFGFFLPCFAYVVARRRARRVFWSALGVGSLIAAARILLGAHFLSDVVYSFVITLGTGAIIHALLFGRKKTFDLWRVFLGLPQTKAA